MDSVERYHTKNQTCPKGSYWFKRFWHECKKISPHIRFKRIKHGFYRIYWRDAYLHECYKEMPQIGYDWVEEDRRLNEFKSYYEEYEDNVELTRKIKNYMEGYWDSLDRIQTRVWLMRNKKEHYDNAKNAYKKTVIK